MIGVKGKGAIEYNFILHLTPYTPFQVVAMSTR